MTTEEAKRLISKYNAGNCTDQEKALLEKWYMQLDVQDVNISPKTIESLGEQIKNLPGFDGKSKIIKLWSVIAAVVSITLIAAGVILFNYRSEEHPITSKIVQDIAPGSNKATLTFANGKVINLSCAKTGIAVDAAKIKYNDGTKISRNNADSFSGLATITTPKGGEYHIVLSDGTKVWLNAASTLTFATSFRERGEDKRRVTLSGEAYFEVSKDKSRPFVVKVGHQEILVLGTHFNINAYEPKAVIKTTLQEGAVRVISLKKDRTFRKSNLKPGEQAISSEAATLIKKVNVELELAWKKGKIQFVRADLKSVMDMISRWYDIEVIYQYYPKEAKFTGSISRSKNISEVLSLLETTGEVRFKIEERKVFVMK
ncbi:FecR family protein [Pedobacter frigoris]|uniref:DUF4974 domain-containing protein n=1 Tax=Pedobacter frigoris TaxID=2571272 RepID=A0A4U1CLR8_9SPHI|nr:FecR family protein [Pedobacter frigoris]TKC07496.1 DUF4974 domain-containing protein [Pedobacter frigoris]